MQIAAFSLTQVSTPFKGSQERSEGKIIYLIEKNNHNSAFTIYVFVPYFSMFCLFFVKYRIAGPFIL